MNYKNPLPLVKLIEQFAALPGIGYKTAQRLAYHMLTIPKEQAQQFSQAILDAQNLIKQCQVCKNFTDSDVCKICDNHSRDKNIICVVEDPKDINAFERTKEFNGMYHVLHGLISPMDGIGPEQLFIKELLSRLSQDDVKEVIMATSPTLEGDATAMYISRLIKPLGVKVTRLAYGIPVGGNLEYADDITLFKALENRNEM